MVKSYRPEKIHKIVVKISGEILGGKEGMNFHLPTIESIIEEIVSVRTWDIV